MDINWLVQVLKNGEVYTAHNNVGEPYETRRPPTSQTIKAAQVIEQLHSKLQQSNEFTQNLHYQIQGLIEQVEQLKNPPKPEPEPSAE